MVRVTYHIRPFACRKMILHIELIHLLIHIFDRFSHMVRVAIGSNEMKLCYIKFGTEFVNIFFSVKFKYISRIRESVEGFWVEHTFLNDIVDFTTYEAVG